MPKVKIVGVTQRVDKVDTHGEWRDAIDHRLISWVIEAGFFPLPIPNTLINLNVTIDQQPIINKWIKTFKIDAILLSGGNDIGNIPQRDVTENYLLSWAEKNRKPVLGICRGMQMMGVYAGGSLVKIDGHVGARHKLNICDGNKHIFPKTVNSYHNKALKELPYEFKVLAISEDGNLEAMSHNDLEWEGWMWHPEREKKFSNLDLIRFQRLINGK